LASAACGLQNAMTSTYSGALGFTELHFKSMLPPAALAAVMAGAYFAYRYHEARSAQPPPSIQS